MSKWLHIIGTSFGGIRCCDDTVTQTDPANPLGWRALTSSLTCIVDGAGKRTGFVHVVTLQQYYLNNNAATGVVKANTPSDPDYMPDYLDRNFCSVGSGNMPLVVSVNAYPDGNNPNNMLYNASLSYAVVDDVRVRITVYYDTATGNTSEPERELLIPAGELTAHSEYAFDNNPLYNTSNFNAYVNSVVPNPLSDGKVISF